VAPTVSVVVAPASVWAPAAGVLKKVLTIMLLVPSVIVTSADGRVIVIARVGSPEIVKEATVAAGAKPDNVTPPVAERPPAGVNTTVPSEAPLHAVPKCKSTSFAIESGAIITAEAVAEADSCANADAENASITTATARNLVIRFILSLIKLVIVKTLLLRIVLPVRYIKLKCCYSKE